MLITSEDYMTACVKLITTEKIVTSSVSNVTFFAPLFVEKKFVKYIFKNEEYSHGILVVG